MGPDLMFFYLAPAVLAALALALGVAPGGMVKPAVRAIAAAGVTTTVLVAVPAGGDTVWRGFIASTPARAAAVAGAIAWALVVVRPDPHVAALTGAAACGLLLAGSSRWIVIVMLMWMCHELAVAILARDHGSALALLGISDVLLMTGFAVAAGRPTWAIAAPLAVPAVVAAAGIRVAAAAAAPPPAAALIAGGAVTVVALAGRGAAPYAAAAAAVVSVVALSVALGERRRAASSRAGVAALGIAVAGAVPGFAPLAAGAAAASMPTTVATSPAWVLATVPVGGAALFTAVAGAGTVAFDRLVQADAPAIGLPWALFALAVPVGVAGSLIAGARALRRCPPSSLASAAVVALVFVTGAVPALVVPGASSRSPLLLVLGLVVAATGTRALRRKDLVRAVPAAPPPEPSPSRHRPGLQARFGWGALASAALVVAVVLYRGLSVGFLE